jgi:ElaB/YqjD/DUF883 family membrane-anchored ribosome-binding protein
VLERASAQVKVTSASNFADEGTQIYFLASKPSNFVMSVPPGADLASLAVQHDTNGDWQQAIEYYTRAADVIEYAINSGQALPAGLDFPGLIRQYRERAAALAQKSHSTISSMGASANSMFQKLKSSAEKAAGKTKETAVSVGQSAKTAASSAYTTTTKAVNKKGTFANKVADSAAHGLGAGLGGGFGWTVGNNAGQAVSRTLFPTPPRKK